MPELDPLCHVDDLLAYFGYLCSAEFTVPNLASFLSSVHVAVDSMSSPLCLRLRINASKTDPFCKGCFLHIGRAEFPFCAIRSLLAYLTLRGDAPGPLFLFRDRRPLTCALLTSWLRDILSSAGIQGNFSSHSFRIGAAMFAARNGIPDHQIQVLGRWTSLALFISGLDLFSSSMWAPGQCSDRDLYSWHGRWPPKMFLVSGCMDLVCQAEQRRILLAFSVQLGRHSRALGVVCMFFGLFVGLGLGIGA